MKKYYCEIIDENKVNKHYCESCGNECEREDLYELSDNVSGELMALIYLCEECKEHYEDDNCTANRIL